MNTIDLIIAERAIRGQRFDGDTVRDDCRWSLLLLAAAQTQIGRRVTVTDACALSGHPQTTALRHLDRLYADDLMDRVPDMRDGRRVYLRLSPRAEVGMAGYLADVQAARMRIAA